MKKKQILDRLWTTIEQLVNLSPRKFKYSETVAKGDLKKVCGTVCCVAGWYPKWFPESGLEYRLREISVDPSPGEVPYVYVSGNHLPMNHTLKYYHGLAHSIINFLFYGECIYIRLSEKGEAVADEILKYWRKDIYIQIEDSWYVQMKRGLNSNLAQVIMGFRFIHYMIENDYIENYNI